MLPVMGLGGEMEQDVLVSRTILIGTEGRPEDERAFEMLCGTLDVQRVRLRIVHVLTVPMTAPLDVPLAEAEAQGAGFLTRAREIADRYDMPIETALLRGRTVGECLVEEARRTMASAVCVRFRSRPVPMGHHVAGSVVTTLLDAAPCPVIILHLPHK